MLSTRGLMIAIASIVAISVACGSESTSQALPTNSAGADATLITAVTAQISGTPTPLPTASPTSTKVAPATAVPTLGPPTPMQPPPILTPTPTHLPADALEVNYLDADVTPPSVISSFERLLARIPDTEEMRTHVIMSDIAALRVLVGVEPPGQEDDADAVRDFIIGLFDAVHAMFPVNFQIWPLELRDYWASVDTFGPMGFDWRNTDQTINVGTPPNMIDVAFGRYDPEITALALAKCECDQPEIREHNGVSYYSWGESGLGDLEDRFKPPFYDHIGRGPRLLIEDGAAIYAIRDGNIPAVIDATSGKIQSLAGNTDYALGIRWLSSLGTIGDARIANSGFSVEHVRQIGVGNGSFGSRSGRTIAVDRTAESVANAVEKGPLLLPFEFVLTGNGLDDESPFIGLVVVHRNPAEAEENVQRLIERIREGAFQGRFVNLEYTETRWIDLIRRIDIQSYGRFLVARLFGVDGELRLSPGGFRDQILTVHE